MVCALTGGKSSKAEMLSLATNRHFIDWLHKQAVFTHSARFPQGRVTQILLSLAQDYNNCASRLSGEDRPGSGRRALHLARGSPAGCHDHQRLSMAKTLSHGSSDASGWSSRTASTPTRALPLASTRHVAQHQPISRAASVVAPSAR